MQPAATQPEKSSHDSELVLHSNRERHTSDRSIKALRGHPESSDAQGEGRRRIGSSSPQPGSSREMTPSEGVVAIKYTRTGRVSRANKGQRVHHCEECGKTYTRAEHLRRHKQNHKPGAFPCDITGCSRSFYREDLLIRHKVKQHNESFDPESTIPSPSTQHSEPRSDITGQLPPLLAGERQVLLGTDPEILQIETTQPLYRDRGQRIDETSTQKRSRESSFLSTRSPSIPVITHGHFGYENNGYTSDSTHSLSGHPSPNTNQFIEQPYHLHSGRTRQSSNSSFLDPILPSHTSPSPVSAGSSTIYQPYWPNNTQGTALQYLGQFSDSNIAYTDTILGRSTANMTGVESFSDPRDWLEQVELSVHMDSPESSTWSFEVDDYSSTKEDKYLAAYWHWIHPFYSVVHSPSFNPHTASPLLKAAMLALGANSLGGTSDKTHSRIIHERCTKALKKRALNPSNSLRICDMQAVVLIEIYSIFRSRRPPLELSRHFEDVYQMLANDPEALHVVPVGTNSQPSSIGIHSLKEEFPGNLLHSHFVECKQRLLLTCYMLDRQHAMLFGRPRSKSFLGDGVDLPFPRPQALWDENVEQRLENFVHWPTSTLGDQYHLAQSQYDEFQSTVTMESFFDLRINTATDYPVQSFGDTTTLPIEGQSPRTEMAHHSFALCENTPIRDLLAVAGESWIMSEKLGREDEFRKAQVEAFNWAMGHTKPKLELQDVKSQSQVQLSLMHALKILELHQSHPKTGLIFQEWSVYLATVVVWARAYVLSSERRRDSAAEPAERRLSFPGLDRVVSLIVAAGSDSNVSLESAMNILLWTQKKIASVDIPHNCGLTNGALDVLGRLVMRGAEPGWFGK